MTELDTRLLRFLYGAAAGELTLVALFLSAIGSGWVMLGLIPLFRWPAWRRFAGVLLALLASVAGIVAVIKGIVARARPCTALPDIRALCAAPTDPSFPSGHAAGSFAFASFVVVVMYSGVEVRPELRRRLSAAAVALAFGIAWSRVYLGVHFPGDVAAGALLGTLLGTLAAWLYRIPVGLRWR
jgi:undecaprenyl-diphosphatase